MTSDLTYPLATFSDPQVREIVWEELWVCPTCFQIHGNWVFRTATEPVEFYQRCLCEPVERISMPKTWDTPVAVRFCHCCAATLLCGGSRWSVWFCDPCKRMVSQLHEELRALVIPLGSHSFHSGDGIKGGYAPPERDVQAFVATQGDLRTRIAVVHQWSMISTQANIAAVELAQEIEVPLYQLLSRLGERGIDRARKFAAMAAFAGVALERIEMRRSDPYPQADDQADRDALLRKLTTSPKDLVKSDHYRTAIGAERRAYAEVAAKWELGLSDLLGHKNVENS